MTILTKPTTFNRSQFTISTYGHVPIDADLSALTGTPVRHIVMPPNGPGQAGFQSIATYPTKTKVAADGILITAGTVIGMYSADCPILVLMDERSGCGIAAHCGRPAMTKRQVLMKYDYNIITAALLALQREGSRPENLTAYITAGICQDCFTHDVRKPGDAELLRPFPKAHIHEETGGLDLIGLIIAELVQAGVPARNISTDDRCTKEHPDLTSHRGGKPPGIANLVIADSH